MKFLTLSRIKVAALNASRYSVGISLLLVITACDSGNTNDNNMDSQPLGMADAARNANLDVGVAVASTISTEQASTIAREFTSITAENAMKWSALEPAPGRYDFAVADQQVESAIANGQRLRGHTLFWHRVNGPPSWLNEEVDKASVPAARRHKRMWMFSPHAWQ